MNVKIYKKLGIQLLTVITISAFPVIFLYCKNSDQVDIKEITIPLLLFLGLGLLLFFALLCIVKSVDRAVLTSVLFIFIITNFRILEKFIKIFFPSLKYWHTVPIIFLIGLHITFIIWKFLSKDILSDVIKVLCIVFTFLLIMNMILGFSGAKKNFETKKQMDNNDKIYFQNQNSGLIDGKISPNIYLLLFDEYANFPQMKKYYNYDNLPLESFLKNNNFSISYTSHNESISTQTILTNLMNLEYLVNDSMSDIEKINIRKNGKLFNYIKSNGYTVDILEVGDFLGGHMPNKEAAVEKSKATTINGETIVDLCIQQSIFYPFYKSGVESERLEPIIELVSYLSQKENLPRENTFTIVYLCIPHQPFWVDENGMTIPLSQSVNWEDKRYYLGQYKYTTKLMLQILDNIVKNDPNSIIFLQSDHGARGREEFTLEFQSNNLNAVYYKGEKNINVEGMSSVNILRYILNKLWGTTYEMLTVPKFG